VTTDLGGRRVLGQVVSVASLLAVVTVPYSASKRGLCALGDTLRLEYGDRLAVTTVYPGYAATPIHGPAAERSGQSLAGIAPEETPQDAARAIERRPRDTANTWQGAVVLRAARAAARLVDAGVRSRARRAGMLPAAK
jgi:NAD(P)-dependent dehydrogenase (short-subunit alcohol dehydrogenase family)